MIRATRQIPTSVLLAAALTLVQAVACQGGTVLVGRAGPAPGGGADADADADADAPPPIGADAAADADEPFPDCDHDRDGWESLACGGLDCDDAAADVHPEAAEAEEWTVEAIAADASLPAIAIGPAGTLHVAVRARVSGGAELRYLTKLADGWASEDIAPLADGPYAPSIAAGNDRHVHVCWTSHDDRTTEIGYAVTAGHGWHSEMLLSTLGDPSSCAIAVDAHGHVHVAMQDPLSRSLRHGELVNGAWTFQTVDDRTPTGVFPTILLDPWYVPSIGYQDAVDGDLRFAVRSATGWRVEPVADAGLVPGRFLGDFALDPDGLVHASFRDGHLRSLRYATNVTGAWETHVIESVGYTGKSSALGVDSSGHVHVVYSRDDRFDRPDDLLFRTNAAGGWSAPQVVDDEGATGFAPRMSIGPRGLHVVYFRMGDNGRPEVLHAFRAIPDAVDRDCDGQL